MIHATDLMGETYEEIFALEVTDVGGVTIRGTNGNDIIDAVTTAPGEPLPGSEADVIVARAGDDRLEALGGDDLVYGGDGDDTIEGGAGNDTLRGGAQGPLGDTASYLHAGAGVSVKVAGISQDTGGAGIDTLRGFENLTGSLYDDVLTGGSSANVLTGLDGDDILKGADGGDRLEGGDGSDIIKGGDGDDTIVGGPGLDRLFGNAGADIFKFESLADSGLGAVARDRIFDFGAGDRIDLTALAAEAGVSFVVVGTDAFSGFAGELRQFTNASGNTVIAGDADGNGGADFQIVVVGAHSLQESDFLL